MLEGRDSGSLPLQQRLGYRSQTRGGALADPVSLVQISAAALTLAGLILDYVVSPEEKEKIRCRAKDRLEVFRKITPRNFGREEISWAIDQLERLVGARFLSWRRLIAACGMVLMAFTVITVVAGPSKTLAFLQGTPYAADAFRSIVVVIVPFLMASMSLSLWMSRAITRIPHGNSLLGVVLLLAVHVILLLVWRHVMYAVEFGIVQFIQWVHWPSIYELLVQVGEALATMWKVMWEKGPFSVVHLQYFSVLDNIAKVDLDRLHAAGSYNRFIEAYAYALSDLSAFFANTLRIGLTVIFLLCLLYVRVLRTILIRFWSAFVRSGEALFAPPLSAVSGLIFLLEQLARHF